MTKKNNRLGVLWDPVTGELDAESVTKWETKNRRSYKTGKPAGDA